jgi:hypothetical protein
VKNQAMQYQKVTVSETSDLHVDGWEDVMMGSKKPTAYTFTKHAGPQFNLLPDAEPMDYFSLFYQ